MLCKELDIEAFATVGSEVKAEAVRSLRGEPINHRTEDFADVISARTSGEGVDVILDIMGASYFDKNVRVLARGGRLVIIGFLGGATLEKVSLLALISKKGLLTGSVMRSRSIAEKAAIARDLRAHLWPALAAGRCLPVIDKVFPLAKAAEAHRRIESSEHIGKIVLQIA
jgi:NADPH:quinone reductase